MLITDISEFVLFEDIILVTSILTLTGCVTGPGPGQESPQCWVTKPCLGEGHGINLNWSWLVPLASPPLGSEEIVNTLPCERLTVESYALFVIRKSYID